MITAIYSILHFLVDGVCAFAMATAFANASYEKFLIYNFCAFALQMPIGTVLDGMSIRTGKNYSKVTAVMGVVITLAGAFINPAILGIGNALFHVGAGVSVIREDYGHKWRGQAFGIFVAPGALGLFAGAQLATQGYGTGFWVITTLVMLIFSAGAWKVEPKQLQFVDNSETKNGSIGLLIFCFVIVVLRSYVGLAVEMPWKTTFLASMIGVFAVVLGKMTGGIVAANVGYWKTMSISLGAGAVAYCFSSHMVPGVVALFLLNMTMPITLYLLVDNWRRLPGFSFGLLTFGLFLGFLPVYFGWQLPELGGEGVYYLTMFGVSLLLTQVLELGVLLGVKKWSKQNVIILLLVNVLTNPAAVYLAFLGGGTVLIQVPIEIAVILVEGFIYKSFGMKKPFRFALLANGISWMIGLFL